MGWRVGEVEFVVRVVAIAWSAGLKGITVRKLANYRGHCLMSGFNSFATALLKIKTNSMNKIV